MLKISETKERCGFFLNVFGLELPDYLLKCSYFPDNPDSDVCIGHREVKEAKNRAKRPGKHKISNTNIKLFMSKEKINQK